MTQRPSPPVLRGTYTPPALRPGYRVDCLVRDCLMIVRHWSDAPIPWPFGCPPGRSPGSPSLIVEEELARAVRQESATAVAYWWGVTVKTVIKWRTALGVTRQNNAGSQTVIRVAIRKARAARRLVVSEGYRQKQREHALRRRVWELRPAVTRGLAWTAEQKALLGTMADREVAVRTGHPLKSVRHLRAKLQIACYRSSGQGRSEKCADLGDVD